MRRNQPWLALSVYFAILLPVVAADDNADTTPKPDSQIKKQYDKLIKSGKSFLAKLVKINADQHYLTVEVSYKSPKQDVHTVQHLANLQAQMVDAQRQRNPVERAKQVNRIQLEIEKAMANLYKDVSQKIDLDAPEDMKVRTMLLPLEFDEKGKPRRLTEKEKRALKGPDPALPGYTADLESLKPDQLVEIYLAKQAPKSRAKDKDPDAEESTRPKIAMIVIRAEAQK
jgi:hypothetical protein